MIAPASVLLLLLLYPADSPKTPASAGIFDRLSREAAVAREANRNDEAIGLYGRGLEMRPEWEEGLWYLSTLFYEKERFGESRDLLRRFVALQPKAGAGWALLGMSEFKTREYDRALTHLERALALGLNDRKELADSVYYETAVLLVRQEKFDDAMLLLMDLAKSGRIEALLIEPIGLAALRLPLLPAEVPEDRRVMVRLAGEATLKRSESKKLEQLVALYPNEPGVHYLLGVYQLATDNDEGIKELNRELELSPGHVLARLHLSEHYIKSREVEKAFDLANQAVKLAPKQAAARMIYGEVLLDKKDVVAALRELEAARDLDPQAIRVRWDLVKAYLAAARPSDADREKAEIEKLSQWEKQK